MHQWLSTMALLTMILAGAVLLAIALAFLSLAKTALVAAGLGLIVYGQEAAQPDADAEDKPNRSAELKADEVAVEIEPPWRSMLTRKNSAAATLIRRDDGRERRDRAAHPSAHRRHRLCEDRPDRRHRESRESPKRRISKLFAEGQILKSSDTERMNEIQGDLAALILRKTRTRRSPNR